LQQPNCTDPACQTSVCADNPLCCTEHYDSTCVLTAVDSCPLPAGDNTCFEVSESSGCHENSVCLKAVCKLNADCCGLAYTEDCVDIARRVPQLCVPSRMNNTCGETSPVGGCSDFECEASVCADNPECCNSETLVGEWTSACVEVAASDVCPE
jgi:hypothetical protein